MPAPPPAPAPATTATQDPGCAADMHDWMNQARGDHGLAPLAEDGGLRGVPLAWSDSMASRQQLAHNPNYADQVFGARAQAMTVGENVGRSTGSARTIFDAFMQSPGHRDKILGGFSHAVTGCIVDPGGQRWVTVNFWG